MTRYIILIISLFFTSCIKAQSGRLGIIKVPPPHSIIIFSGESNSGGIVPNTSATTLELADRPSVKILNNNSLLLENLHIGVNNLIGHSNLSCCTTHGWELGLANSVDSGTLTNPVYLVKTGQGGSSIRNWSGPDTSLRFYDSLTNRVDSAKKILTTINNGVVPSMYLFYSQGINDALYVPNDSANWKTRTKLHFSNLRNRYGHLPIFITYLPTVYSFYNARITEICSEVSECYPIQTSDATLLNANHWDYAGMKLIATRMIYTLKSHYTYY